MPRRDDQQDDRPPVTGNNKAEYLDTTRTRFTYVSTIVHMLPTLDACLFLTEYDDVQASNIVEEFSHSTSPLYSSRLIVKLYVGWKRSSKLIERLFVIDSSNDI